MKNIQIIDGADNATFSIFQATPEESGTIFPQRGQDLEVVDNYFARVGEAEAHLVLCAIWERPIHKPDFQGLHGTLFYDYAEKAKYLPQPKRELDRHPGQLNPAQRALYDRLRKDKTSS